MVEHSVMHGILEHTFIPEIVRQHDVRLERIHPRQNEPDQSAGAQLERRVAAESEAGKLDKLYIKAASAGFPDTRADIGVYDCIEHIICLTELGDQHRFSPWFWRCFASPEIVSIPYRKVNARGVRKLLVSLSA
jgi:hypothetical protein